MKENADGTPAAASPSLAGSQKVPQQVPAYAAAGAAGASVGSVRGMPSGQAFAGSSGSVGSVGQAQGQRMSTSLATGAPVGAASKCVALHDYTAAQPTELSFR